MGALVTWLQRTGFRKGLSEGNRRWLAVGIGAWGFTRLARMAVRQEHLVFREQIRPGEKLVISYGGESFEVEG